jgi:hypothetical protein
MGSTANSMKTSKKEVEEASSTMVKNGDEDASGTMKVGTMAKKKTIGKDYVPQFMQHLKKEETKDSEVVVANPKVRVLFCLRLIV